MYYSFFIAILVTVTWAFVVEYLYNKRRGASNYGDYANNKAKECGDVTIAELIESHYLDEPGGLMSAQYLYSVDGKSYKFRTRLMVPEETMEICYDRRRHNKYIEPGKRNFLDLLRALSIPVVFVITLYLLTR